MVNQNGQILLWWLSLWSMTPFSSAAIDAANLSSRGHNFTHGTFQWFVHQMVLPSVNVLKLRWLKRRAFTEGQGPPKAFAAPLQSQCTRCCVIYTFNGSGNQRTCIVLRVYTFIIVFVGSLLRFYQYKNHKSGQIFPHETFKVRMFRRCRIWLIDWLIE